MDDTTGIINKALSIIGKSVDFVIFDEAAEIPETIWTGIDWAKGSGMTRGDVISRNDNVIEVRFRTV